MLLRKIKESKEKAQHQFVSIEDFAEYTGITVNLIKEHLAD